MTEITLIRHGETDWNVIGRYQGQADPPLNRKGIEQSWELAQKLSLANLDIIISSPLKRAAQTAQIITSKLDLPLEYDERLMEIHQGDWQTRLRSDIEAMYPELFEHWETAPWEVNPPGGEHLSQVQQRVDEAIDEILCRHPTGRVGLVTHRIPIALIKLRYQDLDPDIVRTLQLPNTYHEVIQIKCRKEA